MRKLIDEFRPANLLLDWMDILDGGRLDEKYKLRTVLLPRWKNFLLTHVDRFDRYPEMITHGSTHICNVLSLTAELLDPRLRRWHDERKIQNGQRSDCPITAEEIFLLLAGVFLHDIGMADTAHQEVRLGDIRREHGLRSKDLLRELFRARGRGPVDLQNDLLPTFKLSGEVDLVGEICAHHQGRMKLSDLASRREHEPCLKEFNGKPVDVLFVTSLLRFLDACDTQYSRAGSVYLTGAKVRSNHRLLEECLQSIEEHRALLAAQGKETSDTLCYLEERVTYLQSQARVHFPKHSVIQKVWLLDDQVVYKPITPLEQELLGPVLPAAYTNLSQHIENFLSELRRELDGEGGREGCRKYLELRDIRLREPRKFDPVTDPAKLSNLAHWGESWPRAPSVPDGYVSRGRFEQQLVERLSREDSTEHPSMILVVGPDGVGKTWLARKITGQLRTQAPHKRICFVALDGVAGCSDTETLDWVIEKLVHFLASWGDYLFYNKARMEHEIEEYQWDILFRQLAKPDHMFVLDDAHHLRLETSRLLRAFFSRFFESLRSSASSVVIFSRKVPYTLAEDERLQDTVVRIPPIPGIELDRLCVRPTWFPWRKGIKLKPGDPVRELLERYSGMPVILEELKRLGEGERPGRTQKQEDTICAMTELLMHRRLRSILRIVNSDDGLSAEILQQLIRHPGSRVRDPHVLAQEMDLESSAFEAAWRALILRQLVFPVERGEGWRADRWWASLGGNRWRMLCDQWIHGECESSKLLASIPALQPLVGLNQGYRDDAWTHSLAVFRSVLDLLEAPRGDQAGLPRSKQPDSLALAAILHDVGKQCCRTESEGSVRFLGHEDAGGKLAAEVCEQLRLEVEEKELVVSVVRNHMRPVHLINDAAWPPSDKAIRRLVAALVPHVTEVLLLARADLEHSGRAQEEVVRDRARWVELTARVLTVNQQAESAKMPFNGGDLLGMGMAPGPLVGVILQEAVSLWESGELTSREDCVAWAKARIVGKT